MFKTYLRMFVRAALRRENFTTLRVCFHVFARLFAQNAMVIAVISLSSMFIINMVSQDFEQFASRCWPFFIVGIFASLVLALQTAYEFQVREEAEQR